MIFAMITTIYYNIINITSITVDTVPPETVFDRSNVGGLLGGPTKSVSMKTSPISPQHRGSAFSRNFQLHLRLPLTLEVIQMLVAL